MEMSFLIQRFHFMDMKFIQVFQLNFLHFEDMKSGRVLKLKFFHFVDIIRCFFSNFMFSTLSTRNLGEFPS